MNKRRIIVGKTFLHNHPHMESDLVEDGRITDDHVVINREDWEAIREFFNSVGYQHRTETLADFLGSRVVGHPKEALAGEPAPEQNAPEQNAPEQNAGTACEGPKNLVKPPLGIMPRKLWIEIRLKELSEAMYRYISVGSLIPEEWAQEYNQLLSELQK